MTRIGKIRLLNKVNRNIDKFNRQKHVVYFCSNCGFKIAITDRDDPYIECRVGNYYEYEVSQNEYGKYINDSEKNINGTRWSKPANHICLNCGNSLLFNSNDENKICEECNSKNIVFWNELPGKKCPSCNGTFNDGIVYNTYDEYSESNFKEQVDGLAKAKKKYGIKEDIKEDIKEIKIYTEEERQMMAAESELREKYLDQWYVINNNTNIIKFECSRSFHGPFCIIAEWDNDNSDGKLIFCMRIFSDDEDDYKEIKLENKKIKYLLSVLEKYKYFTKPNQIERYGLDGSTWTLEVQYGKLFKEISVWSPDKGVIYDIGRLLLEYSKPKINEIY
jgi:DNA-directed RNA polymerase subunit RPC12/RpoP